MKKTFLLFFSIVLALSFSCKKIGKEVVLKNNQIPHYEEIPTVVIENYVTRIYIDLLGRDPLNDELNTHVAALIAVDLDTSYRAVIVDSLHNDLAPRPDEISYKHQYYQRLYDLMKGRFLEGASEGEIQKEIALLQGGLRADSITGDSVEYQIKKQALQLFYNVVGSKINLQEERISYNEMCKYMMNNGLYDLINMNTSNFINASFNDLYFRFPTDFEYDGAFEAIEKNNSALLFGQAVSNKYDYLELVTNHLNFYEGMVGWMYQTLFARNPRTDELYNWTHFLAEGGSLQKFQKELLISDEYAFFVRNN
ncbi:MAG: hypothetical protein ACI9YL_000236 [Luteibaculaceae bacterium]|jgi:hypothetical protein